MQFDIVDRLIERHSNLAVLVLDPFLDREADRLSSEGPSRSAALPQTSSLPARIPCLGPAPRDIQKDLQ